MPAPLVILGAAAIARIAASAVARAAAAKTPAQAAAITARAIAKINKGSGSPAGRANPGKAAISKAQKAFDKAGAEGPKAVKPKPATPKPDAKPKPASKPPTAAQANKAGAEGPKTLKQFKADGDKRTFKKDLPPTPKIPKPTPPAASNAKFEGPKTLKQFKADGDKNIKFEGPKTYKQTLAEGPTAVGPLGRTQGPPPQGVVARNPPTPMTSLVRGSVARTMNPVSKKGTKLKKALVGTGGVVSTLAGVGLLLDQMRDDKNGKTEASDSDSSSDSGKTNKATPSVDKYGRKITKEEFEKREAFRKSRKAGADGKSRRVTADRAGAARKTELDRRKKFRKTKGKKKFGDAATRVTKDKSKLAAKGVRQREAYLGRLRREAALSRRDRDFPSR